MKKSFQLFFIIICFIGCSNSSEKKEQISPKTDSVSKVAQSTQSENVKEITPTFTTVDTKVTALFAAVINKYLEVKNALADNNEDDAKKAGKELLQKISKIDKTTLPEDQRKVFGSEEEDLKENAEHISNSNIEHQRMHFSILSQSIYVIARSFGNDKSLYHLFCSKAENNEGAMWLSESTESKNPYLPTITNCGEVLEKIK